MTLPTDTQLEAIHAGISALTSHQRIKRTEWLISPRQCSATVEHSSGLRGKQCTYAASHEIDGQHLCWTHTKIMTRNRGVA